MTNNDRMFQWAGGLILLAVGGCAQHSHDVYSTSAEPAGWSDLSPGASVTSDEGYRLLVPQATEGLFPASISVARIAQSSYNGGQLVLAMKPEVDFLAWNSVFDDFRAVSEVFPLNEKDLDGGEVSAENLMTASEALEAGLMLLYTESRGGYDRCSLSGVLYDVRSRQALAAIHANSLISDPVSPDERKARTASADTREDRDPRLVAVDAFESHVRDCLRRLMTKDKSKNVGPIEGWIPTYTVEPLIWPTSYPSNNPTRR
ncbi:MAG: hypothetical protein DHS20C16_06080 [Phycisphaerae bacterium]|nr:MAG: hypothetical protein DHS20C16_06080 [Phycisphaerae bacterium]